MRALQRVLWPLVGVPKGGMGGVPRSRCSRSIPRALPNPRAPHRLPEWVGSCKVARVPERNGSFRPVEAQPRMATVGSRSGGPERSLRVGGFPDSRARVLPEPRVVEPGELKDQLDPFHLDAVAGIHRDPVNRGKPASPCVPHEHGDRARTVVGDLKTARLRAAVDSDRAVPLYLPVGFPRHGVTQVPGRSSNSRSGRALGHGAGPLP